MKFKVLKDFIHEGVNYKADEIHDADELYDGSLDGLLSLKFVVIHKSKAKKDKSWQQ